MELTRSQKFIRDNARTMRTATEYFNLDTNLMTMEDYEKADLRLLVVFPSPATTKSVSMTASVLNDFVISKCPGVFIDFAFVPEQDDLSTFDKFMIPYAIGNITGLDASHYDLVGFSISILFEAMTTAMIVNSFSRCDRPIPLTWSERKDQRFGETPALYLGGITASVTDVLFGDVGDGRQAFVDFIHLGEFHCVKDFFDHCIESKKLGRTVQENLDTFWPLSPDHNWLYQPQAYKVTYNDRNQIVSNIKINPNAPDMCQPYYPDEIPHLNGAARGIIQGNGGNAGLGQFMAANGCSRSGFCNFSVAKGTLVASEAGLVRIEELEGCGPIRLQSTGVVTAQNVEKQKRERVYRVVLESGSFLDCSLSHKWIRAVDVGKRERRYTTRQIRNRLKKGEEFVVLRKIGNHLGFGPLHLKVKSLISMSKRIDFRAMQKSFEDVEWTNKGYCYRTGLNYAQNMIEINNWITDFNFAGYDTSVEVTNRGYAVIYFWPVANSVVHDRVMSVIKLNKFSDMYDVVETDDHTVCYNSIVTSNCFAKGTLVTTDKGMVRIENIKVGDRVFNGHGMFEEVTAVYANGKKDGLRFVLDDGNELTVTEDHDLLDEFERVKFAKDFKVGDLLCFRTFDVDSGKTPEYDYRWLYLAGYLLGDGSLYLRGTTPIEARWFFSRSSQGIHNFNVVTKFLSDVGVPFRVDDNPKNTTVRIVVRDRESLLRFFMLIGDKESLTDEVLSLNCNSFLWFLSGIIASDGTILKQGSIQLGMSRKELILDIYRKAQQFGMATKVSIGHYKQSASDNPRFQKYEGRPISKYRILFTQLDNIRFTPEQIASFGEGKSERVRFPGRQVYRRSKGKIVKIERVSGIETYNLTVSPNHKLLVQGNILSEQCHEGAFTGGWVENTPDRLVELAKISRRYTAATTLKAYSFNCVSEDTPVITEEGIKRASQLSGNEKVVTPYGYSGFILNKGTSDSLEHLIMSQGADLKLTPNHRQLVLSDSGVVEVPAKEVKVGDWIPFTVGTARTVARNSIWFALGLWYGDGCSMGNSNYFVFNLFEVDNAKNLSPWIQRETKTTTPSICYFLATKEFTRKVREIFPNGKEDISKLYSLGLQELVDFVQGLFDADGSGVKGWLKISQKASRKELLNLISTVLLSVGVRTSFSPRIDVTLPGRQKVYSRYDLRVVGQESRIAFLQTFNNHTGKLDYVNCDDRISNRDLCIPPLVGVILAKEFVRVFGKKPSGFNRSKFFKGIKGITVSKFLEMFAQYKEVIPIVNDIVNGTRFAKVVSRETLKGNFPVVDVCETTGGVFNIAGFWTHNSNYLSDYKRSIYDWMSIFPHVTFNNMRLEELGLDPDALKMMKLSGYKRMTAPLEGVSQRVRNNFLNKNLSEKAIDAYLTYGMMMGAVECKIGIVLTGFEEDQDWQEFFDFNEKWQKKAREMGGKIPFRYNMTYLVHYPHTPAEYWERRSVRTALYGGFLMPYKWNKKMTDNKIRIKINGFKHSTLIEQALIDLGRELTSWLYQYLIKPGYPIYSFKPVVNRKEAWEELVSRINIDYFFNERKFDEYISVSHRIHVALHANVILQAMRTLQGGLNAQPTIRCLKTYDGCPVECKANAFARNPLITYGDAWINDKGKLEGVVWEEVKGCQRCKTVEDRKKVLTRTLPKSKTANDILSFKAPALRLRLRFRVERSEPYDVLSPRTTAFTSLSMFLKESQELTDMFWELENNYNMYWQSEKEYFYTVSGQMIYDVTFRDRKAKEIVESLIETVNAKAKTFRIISVSEVPLTSQIKPTDLNVFYFESTIPAELWQYASMMYKGEVKAEDESGMMATKVDSSLRPPQFTLEDKVKGYFVIPCRYSPWCYLQGLMSSKRVALRKLLKTTKVRCLTTVRETNISCVCGKENAVVDMTTGLYKPLGLNCLVNWFTNKIKK